MVLVVFSLLIPQSTAQDSGQRSRPEWIEMHWLSESSHPWTGTWRTCMCVRLDAWSRREWSGTDLNNPSVDLDYVPADRPVCTNPIPRHIMLQTAPKHRACCQNTKLMWRWRSLHPNRQTFYRCQALTAGKNANENAGLLYIFVYFDFWCGFPPLTCRVVSGIQL